MRVQRREHVMRREDDAFQRQRPDAQQRATRAADVPARGVLAASETGHNLP